MKSGKFQFKSKYTFFLMGVLVLVIGISYVAPLFNISLPFSVPEISREIMGFVLVVIGIKLVYAGVKIKSGGGMDLS